MCIASWSRSVVSASLLVFLAAAPTRAQTTDVIGVRAQGMAGAFTAVADDATAGWWNPAGLAGGALFNGLIEYGRPERSQPESVRGFAAAYPATPEIDARIAGWNARLARRNAFTRAAKPSRSEFLFSSISAFPGVSRYDGLRPA